MGSGEDSLSGALQNLTGIEASDIMHIANDFLSQEGVLLISADDFECTAAGTDMNVDVDLGIAYVENDDWSRATSVTRFWRVESDEVEEVTLDAADVSQDRIDLIVLRINDAASADDEASNVATVDKVTGTAAASPTAPTVPDDAIKLAEVYVSAAVTTVSNSDITDSRLEVSLAGAGSSDGWIDASETWTYASADDPIFTFYATGDVTGIYQEGMRVKLTQSATDKYFIIHGVSAYDGGNNRTTITVFGGTDYDLVSATISNPQYSSQYAPYGFDVDRELWKVETTDNTNIDQASPTSGTWYNVLSFVVPIGKWNGFLQYESDFQDNNGGTAAHVVTVGNTTAAAGFADATYALNRTIGTTTMRNIDNETIPLQGANFERTTKATYYMNQRTTVSGVDNIRIRGDILETRVVLYSNYI